VKLQNKLVEFLTAADKIYKGRTQKYL